MRAYPYVGPKAIKLRIAETNSSKPLNSDDELHSKIQNLLGSKHYLAEATFTFVIDLEGQLRLADRRSEHVACVGGAKVLAAGEMTFELDSRYRVVRVTNQSTGYCPEPACWPAICNALDRLGVERPLDLEPAYEFRRCVDCGQTNLIKNTDFTCAVCGKPLPMEWNFANSQF